MVERSDPRVWPALEQLVDRDGRVGSDVGPPVDYQVHGESGCGADSGGHRVSAKTVARLLKNHRFSLRGNVKTLEGKQHPDQDGQFRCINSQVATFLAVPNRSFPLTRKRKELVGNYTAGGREYQPAGEPVAVDTYDFIGGGKGRSLRGVCVAGNVVRPKWGQIR